LFTNTLFPPTIPCMQFELHAPYTPTGDQPMAIERLTQGLYDSQRFQTLLGVTGSGKTFTMANIIQNVQRPTLVISHNKTLAAQLTSELKEYFPHNAVHYFVSYYDYYQPEAYIPRTDTYIEKETQINEEIDRLRHATTQALLTRRDVIIVASVSCIYALGDPDDYEKVKVRFKTGSSIKRMEVLRALANLQYSRTNLDLDRGTFRAQGELLEIFPPYETSYYQIRLDGNVIESIALVDKLSRVVISTMDEIDIFPAKHFVIAVPRLEEALENIQKEMEERVAFFLSQGKHLEAERITQRTQFDLEMIKTTGYCAGIENYSGQLSFRERGVASTTLIDYFPDDFLMCIDESHITIPQISGMYGGDQARKKTLIDYGFRLPSAADNRPLNFKEFEEKMKQVIFVSATPSNYEFEHSTKDNVVEQLLRPTGLLDPIIIIKPPENQLEDLLSEIRVTVAKGHRVLVTTITKRLAEELSEFLKEEGVKTHYLHSDIHTMERLEILHDLRSGMYDVLVGINLLREGLDLPEVSLVAILDADKEGFLRSSTSLVQIMGRAARHSEGRVIMYASKTTNSMAHAIAETTRRRVVQERYNTEHGVTPTTIIKALREDRLGGKKRTQEGLGFDLSEINPEEIPSLLKTLRNKMEIAVKNLEFENAALLRDHIIALRKKK